MKEYFKTELGILYKGDAWKILQTLPNKSADLVILDPPYMECRDVRMSGEEWCVKRRWLDLFREISRIMKDTALIFLFGAPSYYLQIASIITRFFDIYFDLIWVKPAPIAFLNAKRRPLSRHEQILCLVKKDCKVSELTYNYREIGSKGKPYVKRGGGSYDRYADEFMTDTICKDGFRYPTTVVEFPNKPHMPKEERTEHPTQKPIALMEWLVKGWSKEGDLVLDPFAGSGSTLIACEMLGRKWIAIEIDEKWCNLIRSRIENAKSFNLGSNGYLTLQDYVR